MLVPSPAVVTSTGWSFAKEDTASSRGVQPSAPTQSHTRLGRCSGSSATYFPGSLSASGSGKGPEERIKIGQEIWKIAVDELWAIGTVGLSPAFMGVRVTSGKMENVPSRHFNVQDGQTPNLSRPSTFFFKS